jgi:aspartate-semialdehyde dehydrogenase
MTTTPVAVLGATGAVGQQFVRLVDDHPTLELVELVGASSAGQRYGEAVDWIAPGEVPEAVREETVLSTDADLQADAVFSAIPSSAARKLEPRLAEQGKAVFTNASAHRMEPDVPLVIPDVNPGHLDLVAGEDGYIVANPNCSAIVATTPLKPLLDEHGLDRVDVVTLQALSGAGYPGVPSLDATANVLPRIGGEEDKIEAEPCKILGRPEADQITNRDLQLSATATRVPVPEGHLIVLHVDLADDASPEAVAATREGYEPPAEVAKLHASPERVIRVHEDPDRPQPRRDAYTEDGMGVAVGRVREDPNGTVKLVTLGSNTVRGAAGCSVVNAELAVERDYLG